MSPSTASGAPAARSRLRDRRARSSIGVVGIIDEPGHGACAQLQPALHGLHLTEPVGSGETRARVIGSRRRGQRIKTLCRPASASVTATCGRRAQAELRAEALRADFETQLRGRKSASWRKPKLQMRAAVLERHSDA